MCIRDSCRFAKSYLSSQARQHPGVRAYKPTRAERSDFYETLCREYPRNGNKKTSCWTVDISDSPIPREVYGKDHVTHIVCKGIIPLMKGATDCAMFMIEQPPVNGSRRYGIHFHVGGYDETVFLREPRDGVKVLGIMSRGAKKLPKMLSQATKSMGN